VKTRCETKESFIESSLDALSQEDHLFVRMRKFLAICVQEERESKKLNSDQSNTTTFLTPQNRHRGTLLKEIEEYNEFELSIISVCNELKDILIEKNRKYGNSYRRSRIRAAGKWGSRKVPFDFHAHEKLERFETTDDEDTVLDLAGYSILELVCKRLDDADTILMRLDHVDPIRS
jgi:hypothetical protein